ncbi:putative iron-sulfur cluster-binding protein [Aspergillus brunneoviolaceus CBS 621.78]|uniref:ISP domain-containing protein n=1 Tax=Aspergillus brunneoviolaceus CBS 621.78 TaxID=1450534 RepID=A0ACD1FYZ3_9EURO|nr:ISP domain-containing protein [Aspergillus brunneoviolaceus CBS 621.78]RAH42194.1 ISP domain-containing protein [Aspergillus brunneoviolaceus CBS 621.78]
MEALYSVAPPASTAPLVVGLLVGLALLYQTWTRSFLQTYFKYPPRLTKLPSPEPSLEHEETIAVSKEPDYPADWWTGSSTYELERRAIFSKHWLCLSHRSQFSKPGDYHTFTVAGYPIFLILGKDGALRAFHNVCRHRAYPVTRKDRGSSTVLGCRYHGWSYNSLGQLIKAPHFDGVAGFDRAQNALFAVHTFTCRAGFVFVNLDASLTVPLPEVELLDAFVGSREIALRSRWEGGQTVEGQVNWKLMRISESLIDNEGIRSAGSQRRFSSWLLNRLGVSQEGSASLNVFPITAVKTIERTGYWYTLTCIPVSVQKTSFRLDLYSSSSSSSSSNSSSSTRISEAETIAQETTNRLRKMIAELETAYRSYLEDTRYNSTTPITIKVDTSVPISSACVTPQSAAKDVAVLDALRAHLKLERQQGAELFPAMRKPRKNARFEQAEQLCKELDCVDRGPDMSW